MSSQYVTTVGVVELGVGDPETAGDCVLGLAFDPGATGSVSLLGRVYATPGTVVGTGGTPVAYVVDATDATAAGTVALTASGIVRVRASGKALAASVTALAGGGLTLAWRFVAGRT